MFGGNEIVGKKFFKDVSQDQLFVTSMFMTLQGEGPYRGEPALFIRLAKCNLQCSFCFPAKTKISMYLGGYKRIKDIKVGDEVVAWDEKTQMHKKGTVSKVHLPRSADDLFRISMKSGSPVTATSEHPFWVRGKGWVKTADLQKGDTFSTGEEVSKIQNNWFLKRKEELVYNFEVEEYHTYLAEDKVVHNCDTFFDDGDWLTFDQIEQRIESTIDTFYASKGIERPAWTTHGEIIGDISGTHVNKKRMVLVMTGGEPMLQDNLGPFLTRMSEIFEKTQIESNGTQNTWIPESTTLVCSPKCSEKQGVAVKYLEPRKEVLERADCLKFVMSADQDSPYSSVPEWAHEWAHRTGKQVFVSPMNIYNDIPAASKKQRAHNNGISLEERSTVDEVVSFWEKGLLNMDENQKNHEYAAAYCVTHGFILNIQIHLLASLA